MRLQGDNGKGLTYDLDVPTLRAAELDNSIKTATYNQAIAAQATAARNQAAAGAKAASTAGEDAAAAQAKAAADAAHQLGKYQDADFDDKEASYKAAVSAKDTALNNKLAAFDDFVAKTHVLNRKNRDLAAATAAKNASDDNLRANQERVAYEKDQMVRGENQDRLEEIMRNSEK